MFSRKLLIPNRQRAPHYLRFIGYYRHSDYALFFPEQNSRNFKSNAGSDWLSCLPKPDHIQANAMGFPEKWTNNPFWENGEMIKNDRSRYSNFWNTI
ncbi:MAG: hypothetical protein JXR80_02545 [Deltaproteobacteria bacterium]|nr:hypothetical protein [Deltaproteobacteria bacterium]